MPDGDETCPEFGAEACTPAEKEASSDQLDINYLKSNYFRVVHCDGAWVGLTPSLALNIVLFSERAALPQRMTHQLNESGGIGPEIISKRVSKGGLVREMEASVIMQPERAKILIDVLQKMLTQLEQANNHESISGSPK